MLDKLTFLVWMVGMIAAAGLDSPDGWVLNVKIMLGCFAWVIGYLFLRDRWTE